MENVRVAQVSCGDGSAAAVEQWVGQAGWRSTHYRDPSQFLSESDQSAIDLVTLDWQSRDGISIEILGPIRQASGMNTPIMVVGSGEEGDEVLALSHGADDFVARTIKYGAFRARCCALLRRVRPEDPQPSSIVEGPYWIGLSDHVVSLSGRRLRMTDKEYELAVLFFSHLGRLLGRDYLLERVWGFGPGLDTRTVDTHVSRLRRLLCLGPATGYVIRAEYKIGYRLERVAADDRSAECETHA